MKARRAACATTSRTGAGTPRAAAEAPPDDTASAM